VPLASGATTPPPVTATPSKPIPASWSDWNAVMRGIFPVAVTNPIFVNVTGGSYKPPMS